LALAKEAVIDCQYEQESQLTLSHRMHNISTKKLTKMRSSSTTVHPSAVVESAKAKNRSHTKSPGLR